MVEYDLHLAGREEVALDGSQLVGEGRDPLLDGLLVHLPAGGQLAERHRMGRDGMFGHGSLVFDDLEGVGVL